MEFSNNNTQKAKRLLQIYMKSWGGRVLSTQKDGGIRVLPVSPCQVPEPRDVSLKARHLAGCCIPAVRTHTRPIEHAATMPTGSLPMHFQYNKPLLLLVLINQHDPRLCNTWKQTPARQRSFWESGVNEFACKPQKSWCKFPPVHNCSKMYKFTIWLEMKEKGRSQIQISTDIRFVNWWISAKTQAGDQQKL